MGSKLNFLIYFLVTSISLYFLSDKLFPKSSVSPLVPVIKSPAGSVNGALILSKYGRKISAYRGIPYAEPPTGELRFKKPKLILENAWEGILDGSGQVKHCVQPSRGSYWSNISGNEDCLYLNIYVPQTEKIPSDGFPVMAWIHGGGFNVGNSGEFFYEPGFLLDKDVILVTINYRLGIFGFLTLGNEELSGNVGLWDQLGGLKWIKKNIFHFGGNPNQVTLFGESAGGWSVSYHLASENSKDYFNAAIIQSGPLDMGLIRTDQSKTIPEIHKEFVKKVGCRYPDVMKCLQQKSVKDLMNGFQLRDECNFFGPGYNFPLIWLPYDDSASVKNPFFSLHPRKLFENGQFNAVPTMIGMTKDEGLLRSHAFYENTDLFNYFSNGEDCAANHYLGHFFFGTPITEEIRSKVAKIKEEYFGNGNDINDLEVLQNLTNSFTDSGFFYGTDKMARQLSQKTKTFYYHFDHLGSFSIADLYIEKTMAVLKKFVGFHTTSGLGVCHSDDLMFLFRSSDVLFLDNENNRDQNMVDFMVEKWANFATYHDPTPKDQAWPAYGTKDVTYVRLDNSKIIAQSDPVRDERLKFWKILFSK